MAFRPGFLCCSQTLKGLKKTDTHNYPLDKHIFWAKETYVVEDIEELTPSVKKLLTLFGNLL